LPFSSGGGHGVRPGRFYSARFFFDMAFLDGAFLEDDVVIFAPRRSPIFGLFPEDPDRITSIVYAESGWIKQTPGCGRGELGPCPEFSG
jgi:hypothetical protein